MERWGRHSFLIFVSLFSFGRRAKCLSSAKCQQSPFRRIRPWSRRVGGWNTLNARETSRVAYPFATLFFANGGLFIFLPSSFLDPLRSSVPKGTAAALL
jgi:hypothetical protein